MIQPQKTFHKQYEDVLFAALDIKVSSGLSAHLDFLMKVGSAFPEEHIWSNELRKKFEHTTADIKSKIGAN